MAVHRGPDRELSRGTEVIIICFCQKLLLSPRDYRLSLSDLRLVLIRITPDLTGQHDGAQVASAPSRIPKPVGQQATDL